MMKGRRTRALVGRLTSLTAPTSGLLSALLVLGAAESASAQVSATSVAVPGIDYVIDGFTMEVRDHSRGQAFINNRGDVVYTVRFDDSYRGQSRPYAGVFLDGQTRTRTIFGIEGQFLPDLATGPYMTSDFVALGLDHQGNVSWGNDGANYVGDQFPPPNPVNVYYSGPATNVQVVGYGEQHVPLPGLPAGFHGEFEDGFHSMSGAQAINGASGNDTFAYRSSTNSDFQVFDGRVIRMGYSGNLMYQTPNGTLGLLRTDGTTTNLATQGGAMPGAPGETIYAFDDWTSDSNQSGTAIFEARTGFSGAPSRLFQYRNGHLAQVLASGDTVDGETVNHIENSRLLANDDIIITGYTGEGPTLGRNVIYHYDSDTGQYDTIFDESNLPGELAGWALTDSIRHVIVGGPTGNEIAFGGGVYNSNGGDSIYGEAIFYWSEGSGLEVLYNSNAPILLDGVLQETLFRIHEDSFTGGMQFNSLGQLLVHGGDDTLYILNVPEPASLALLGLGGLTVLARRRSIR